MSRDQNAPALVPPPKPGGAKRSWPLLIGAGLAACGLLSLLVVALLALLAPPQPTAALPTLAPTAAVFLPPAVAEPTVTAQPSPTPEPLNVALLAPASGLVVDLGAPLELNFTATDPVGLRSINVTANGQVIGTHNGNGQTAVTVKQSWSPLQAGVQRVVVTAVSRTGEAITSETVTIRVVDRAFLARHAHTFARVEANVTAIRGLAPLTPVEPIMMSRLELRQRLQEDYYYSRDDARRDLLVLYSFDFVPRNFDLYGLSNRYFGDSIAGFYDPQTKELVVISANRDVNALEQWVYAHEFMHALQDQHFGLAQLSDTSLGHEEQLARRALAEGEAELLQQLYVERGYFGRDDLVEIFNLSQRIRSRQVSYIPPVLVNSFLFPYLEGRDFVAALHQRGGWAAVNAAWENPPQSTEHILHPQRYLAGDAPQIVALPPLTGTLGSEWQLIREGVFGEFYLRQYLAQRLDAAEVDTAASGWGGDRYAVYWRESPDAVVMVLRLVWDTANDSNQFAAAYGRYADRRYGSQRQPRDDGAVCWQAVDWLCFYHSGSQTLIVRAPDVTTIQSIAGEVR